MTSGKRRAQLRVRILSWTFIPTAIILLAVAITIFFAYQRVTEDLVVGRNQQLTRLSARQLAADLHSYTDTLNALARSPDIYASSSRRQSAVLGMSTNQLLAFDGGAIILSPGGRVVASTPDAGLLLDQDWSDRSFFRQILRGSAASYSDIMQDGVEQPSLLAVAVPILDGQGQFRGTLVGLFEIGPNNTSAFYGGIVKLRLSESGSTFLVDSAGRVIYHPDGRLIASDLHAQPDVAEILLGKTGYLQMRNAQGVDVLATFAPVPGTSWGLITEENWSGLLAASQGYGQFLVLLLALGILAPIVVVLTGVRRITEPVTQLTAAARNITGGNYGEQIKIQTGDELQELGEQFNRMSAELQQSYTRLEDRVQTRTHELATLNAIAAVASQSLNIENIMGQALDKTLEVLGLDVGAAYSLEGSTLVAVANRNRPSEFLQRASPRPLQGSVVEQAALAQRPLSWLIEDFPEARLKPLLEEEGIAQVVCVPLMAKRKLVGAFAMGKYVARNLTAEELSLLAAIGQQIGVALENAHLYQQAEANATTAERTRLARELHDAVTQTLFSASLIAEVLPEVWEADADAGKRRLEELRLLTRGALAEMRTLLVELRPNALVQIPLPNLIRQLCESLVGRARLPIDVSVDGQRKLPPEVQVALYRITQEALNNVVKHSKATQAAVMLQLGEPVRLSIVDNGRGFESDGISADHLGLKIMRERAEAIGASIVIASEAGEGSRVTVTWHGTEHEREAS